MVRHELVYGSCCRLDEGNYEEPVEKTPGETLGIGDTLELDGLFLFWEKQSYIVTGSKMI